MSIDGFIACSRQRGLQRPSARARQKKKTPKKTTRNEIKRTGGSAENEEFFFLHFFFYFFRLQLRFNFEFLKKKRVARFMEPNILLGGLWKRFQLFISFSLQPIFICEVFFFKKMRMCWLILRMRMMSCLYYINRDLNYFRFLLKTLILPSLVTPCL